MSLFTLDIQVPRKESASFMQVFQRDDTKKFDIISSNMLYSDIKAAYYRIEIFSPIHGKDVIRDLLRTTSAIKYKIRDDLNLYEKSLIEIKPRQSLEFQKSFMATSPAAVETAQESLLPNRSKLRTLKMIKNRLGLFSDGTALSKPYQITMQLERDVYLIARHTRLQAFPLWLDSMNEEQLIKTVVSMAPNYFCVRLSGLQKGYAMDISERIVEQIDIPLIHAEYVEPAITIAAILKNAAYVHKTEIAKKSAGILGLDPTGHGLAELLFEMGFSRVYGIDGDTRQLRRFEKTDGIASSLDRIYETADFIIITPSYTGKLDEARFQPGQIILSFSPNVLNLKNLSPEIAEKTYQGSAPHPVFSLPGLLGALQKHDLTEITLESRLKLVETLQARNGLQQFLPVPSNELFRRQIEALA